MGQKSCRCFDRVALVFFRAQIVHNGNTSLLCQCTASSAVTEVCVQSISGCRTCLSGVLEQHLPGESGHVNHCGLLPFDGVVVLPCMLRYCRLLQISPGALLVLLQPGLQPSPGLTNVYSSCHGCRGFGTPPWTASPLAEGPSLWSSLSAVTVHT